jgi:predicted phage gp36 major capsid-like protein
MFTPPAGWKPFALGALAGAVAITWAGFDTFGWKTAGTAENLGKRQADAAVVSALASICNARFRSEANFASRLAALEKVERYSRGEMVWKAGWATMPGSSEPNQDVGRACAELLIPAGKS